MTVRWLGCLILAGLVAGCARLGPGSGALHEIVADERALATQLLVTTRQDTGPAMSLLGDPGSFYLRRRGYGPTPGVDRRLDRIASDYAIRRVEGWYIASIDAYCEVYELRPGQTMDEVLERLNADPRVELAQAMNLFETQGVVYDDPFASMQPALTALSIESAHEMATGRGVTVAVIDSSVDSRHRELRGKILSEEDLIERRSGNRAEIHGTAVAGIIGSAANNGVGIVGIAPEAGIVSLRACRTADPVTGHAVCSSFSLARALQSAIALDADVINLSLAGPPDALLGALIDAAIARDIVVVTALPALDAARQVFPASHSGVIAAASTESIAAPNVANLLRAPGAEVMSTAPNDSYAFFSGNSMSAAYVSGVAALLREHRPDLSPARLLRLLSDTGDDHTVNACAALAGTRADEACGVPSD